MNDAYVHGYDPREAERLQDQAGTLIELLHGDTAYCAGCRVLEAGCGVGAHTATLATRSPHAHITSVDVSSTSVAEARQRVLDAGIKNVEVQQGDIFDLAFEDDHFDHIFVCFVLEHLSNPVEALVRLRRLLRSGGTITVIEGDHGSTFFHPDSPAAQAAIDCQVELQARVGGNAMIGRQVYSLLDAAGFSNPRVLPRVVYVDASRPHLVDGFTRKTFTAMIEGVGPTAISAGLIDAVSFNAGIQALHRTTERDGMFSYTSSRAPPRPLTSRSHAGTVATRSSDPMQTARADLATPSPRRGARPGLAGRRLSHSSCRSRPGRQPANRPRTSLGTRWRVDGCCLVLHCSGLVSGVVGAIRRRTKDHASPIPRVRSMRLTTRPLRPLVSC